nr:restriction endonuclease subunit S [uncultured Campylobacter sp.]
MKSRILEFKDSGIAWIGQISKHWDYIKLKYFYNFEKGKNAQLYTLDYIGLNQGRYPVYSGQTEQDGIMGYIDTYDYDIDECLFTTTVGAKVMTPKILQGKFSLSQNCLIMKRKRQCNNHFFYYYLIPLFDYEKGSIPSYMQSSLRVEDLKKYGFYVPPFDEQEKIANFLDNKCEKIDSTIKNLEQKISNLKEYKKSLISECVTKGLNSRILEFKDSKIPWIGKIPKHWEVKRLKYIATKIYKGNGITKEQVFENGDTPCVRYGEIYTKYSYSFDKCLSYTFEKVLNSTSYFGYGDILFTCTGELIEEIGKNIVYLGDKKCLAGGDIIVLSHKQNPSFLNYALDCNYARNQKSYGKAKLKVVHISSREISNLFVVLPPLNEQKEIAEFLDKKCEKIDRLNENYAKQISTLKEYKKSLIYECVTGKKEI